jgi:carbon storage regulator
MVVVSREQGQAVIIGIEIEVVVLGVRGRRVSLGIAAPRAVPVHRREAHETIECQALGIKMLSLPRPRRLVPARTGRADLAGVPASR